MVLSLASRQNLILALLRSSKEELSGQALHGRIRSEGGSMGLATVYRHLRSLQQQGEVRCRHLANGEALYAPRDRDVHHLTCVECGSSSALANCPVEQHSLAIHTPTGFTALFHTLEVFGICATCNATK